VEIYKHTDAERKIKLEGVEQILDVIISSPDSEVSIIAEGAKQMVVELIREYD
jgi:hypothetical protein